MHYMVRPVSFRWDDEFIARIDAARGLIPRSAFVRAAIEHALSTPPDIPSRRPRTKPATPAGRGSPSPSLERFTNSDGQ